MDRSGGQKQIYFEAQEKVNNKTYCVVNFRAPYDLMSILPGLDAS